MKCFFHSFWSSTVTVFYVCPLFHPILLNTNILHAARRWHTLIWKNITPGSGQYLSKAVQGGNSGEPATGSWVVKAHWCTWGVKPGRCGPIDHISYYWQCDALGNVLLGNLGSCHPYGCYSDTYLNIVADHLHPFMETVFLDGCGLFQQDNAEWFRMVWGAQQQGWGVDLA